MNLLSLPLWGWLTANTLSDDSRDMSQPDPLQDEASTDDVDDGVRIRGQHLLRHEGPATETGDKQPGLWIGRADGIAPHTLEIQEFGDDDVLYPNSVYLDREEIPKAIEALVERAYARDIEQIRERVELALEDLESQE